MEAGIESPPDHREQLPDYRNYEALCEATVARRLASYPRVADRLGGNADDWSVREVGDGNLNYVYLVHGPSGSVCVKQALPHLRVVGESWPLPLSRSFYEHAALVRQAARSGHVPKVHHFDAGQALIVMETLSPHVIWRKALIARQRHQTAATTVAKFLAETLFRSSDLSLSADEKTREMALFSGNTALCKITEDLVFTDPYTDHPLNNWTRPDLDAAVADIHADAQWKVAVQELKFSFLTRAEALLHGDAHTGSVMVHQNGEREDVRIIDPEFAFYGPMGFDVGATLANLWLSYFSQDGHPGEPDAIADYQRWLLTQTHALWEAFAARFTDLWRTERSGDAFPPRLYEKAGQSEAAETACAAFLARLQVDALGFAGAKMTRRIVGLAGVADLESIEPQAVRAQCERRALALARELLVARESVATVAGANAVAEAARRG